MKKGDMAFMKKKKMVLGFMALMMAGSIMGCQGETGRAVSGDRKPKAAEAVMELEIVQEQGPDLNNYIKRGEINDFVKEAILEDLKIDLTLTGVPEYAHQINVRLSSGDLPDVFKVLNRNVIPEYIRNDVLLDLTPYLDEMEGLDISLGKIDGGIYVISKTLTAANTRGIFVREDWLNKLGLGKPTTYDELMEVAKAFTFHDPDGNGKDDTWGISARGINDYTSMLGAAYAWTGGDGIYIEDGAVTSSIYREQASEAIEMCKSFVAAGVVDPEMIANTKQTLSDKIQQGRVGILLGNWENPWRKESVEISKAVNPDSRWIMLEAFETPYGRYTQTSPYSSGGYYGISADLAGQPERVKRILELFRYVAEGEGNRMVCYGEEGVDFTMKDGKVIMSDDEARLKASAFTWVYQFAGRNEEEYFLTKFSYIEEELTFAFSQPMLINYGDIIIPSADLNIADMTAYIKEEMTKFIYGSRPVSEYADFVKTLEDTYHYKKWLEQAEVQLKDMGLIQ